MLIGVTSDTHIPTRAIHLPSKLVKGLRGVDLIIHAGDWDHIQVYDQLKQLAPVKGVYGSNDDESIRKHFDKKIILSLGDYNIGVIHGDGGKRKDTIERCIQSFATERVDMIIFGHTHLPYYARHAHTLLFNPGSPTNKKKGQKNYSFGMIELGPKIAAKHIFFKGN
ncbi:metallophosphoesterase family protein [Caldalkalibacillus mannanilyticus]|uniref:metallophosphoesterase family protein n=1 Tax=Caldalkalibacillus mannanilyticus TaxID=1418 RepID=UPI0004681D83|nr:metallophosphoesterase family protein [Caldalkalibacillus mannanilyticus]